MSGPIPASTATSHSKPHSQVPQRDQQDPASLRLLSSMQSESSRIGKPPANSAQEIYSTQIAHRSLILRGTSPDTNSQTAREIRRKKRLAGQARIQARQRPRKLSAKEKRKLGVYNLELAPGGRTTRAPWSVWKGLWKLWCGYAWEVLGLEGVGGENGGAARDGKGESKKMPLGPAGRNLSPIAMGPKLASLDLHGALLRVVKAECASVVGLSGVCVRETKFGVILVDHRCCVRRVGKKGAVFRVDVPLPLDERREANTQSDERKADTEQEDTGVGDEKGLDLDSFLQKEDGKVLFEMSGNALLCRPADRATKKFKARKYDGF